VGKNKKRSGIQRYQRLLEITQDLASTFNLSDLLRQIVDAAADLCEAEAASILLYDQNKQELRFEVATNMDNPMMSGFSVPVDSSLAGWIVTHRQPVRISDAQKDQRHFGQVGESMNMTTKTLLGVPLANKDKVIGALEAVNKQSGEFTQQDQDLLIALGAQAAIAIENTRLFQQSDLISEMVHELRTPMASLNTATSLLMRPEITDEQRDRFTKIIRDEIERLSELTTAFLDLARLESGRVQFRIEGFDLKQLLEDCAEMVSGRVAEKGLIIRLELPARLPEIKADRDKIKQVVLNLLSNAIKYNKPDGSITLSAQAQKDGLSFSVSDTGPGIAPENLKSLFQKFYRVPGTEKLAAGTGLGLSISKNIVEAHSGTVSVRSEVGQGTEFTVFLPFRKGK